ncbi:MAG TPA: Na+/H+ antiporter subunit E [Acidimicrobiales bacterium]|nr:Na+/H+ antiporter subunit E [Acidimicrobiales bacterium]
MGAAEHPGGHPPGPAEWVVRILALACWCLLVWILVTWTRTLEQLAFGAVISVVVATGLATLGPVAPPWRVLAPRRFAGGLWLITNALGRILVANVKLAARIWNPRRPVASGMIIVPTEKTSDGGLAAVGLMTSLIVDNQIVDLDRSRHLLQYHAISVPAGSREDARREINGPVEDLLTPIERGRDRDRPDG